MIDLAAGTKLKASYKGGTWQAIVEDDEDQRFVRITDGPDANHQAINTSFSSLSAAGKAITNTSTNGRRFWVPENGSIGPRRAKQSLVGEPKARAPRKVVRQNPRLIKPMPDGRWFCCTCMDSFEFTGVPVTCPLGHPAQAEDVPEENELIAAVEASDA